jgi:hypothetical protein
LGFSLSAVLAYNHEQSPKRSPLRAMQSRISPSERVSKKKRAGDLQESSGDETIDLSVGMEDGSHFFA